MEIETALFWNHIFAGVYWAFCLVIGIVLFVLPRVIKLNSRPRNICKVAGVVMILLFFFARFMCIYTYIEAGSRQVDDECAVTNDVSVMIVAPGTIRFTNNGEEAATVTNSYKLEYLVERCWYNFDPGYADVKPAPFDPVELAPGESVDLTFDISCYGDLKPRHYRYAVNESGIRYYYAEFDITDNGDFIWPE